MLKIAITTHYGESYQPLADIVLPNTKYYSALHGYSFFVNKCQTTKNGMYGFIKTKDARKLLDEFDVVMWIECDAMIMNHNIKIESFLDEEHDVYLTRDVNGENSAVAIFKATQFSKDLLDHIQSKEAELWDEQAVFENYKSDKIHCLPHPSINSYLYELYGESYGKIGEPLPHKPTHEEGNFEVGDFILHCPGMTLDARLKIFNEYKNKIVL